MQVILSCLLAFVQARSIIAAPGAVPSITPSHSLSRGRNSSFGGSVRLPGEHELYPTPKPPSQRSIVTTKSKIWDRKDIEQKRTNNALRAHTAILTTAGNAAKGFVKASVQHLANKVNVHSTPEQKTYSKNVLHHASHNLIKAPVQVHKEAKEMLHNSKLRKKIIVHDYQTARIGGAVYHQKPYTHEENNKLASSYHKENKDFYSRVHAKNAELSHPGTSQGHAIGYPVAVVGHPVNDRKKAEV